MATMTAAVLHGIGDLRIEQRPVPELGAPDHVLARIRAVGVCGSDVHFFTEGKIGPYVVERPLVLGHESCGEVVAVGSAVSIHRVGDRVALEPGVPCRACRYCKEGRYNLCAAVGFMATPPYDGAYCEYVSWPADFAHLLPPGVDFEQGAMVEPLAVAVQAAKRAGVRLGQSAAVLGAGPIGLLTMQVVRAAGCYPVVVTDVVESRLALAAKLGATATVNAGQGDAVAAIREAAGGDGPDHCFETAGTVGTVRQAMQAVRLGGVVTLVGMIAQDEFPVAVMDVICREYDLRGVFRYCNAYPPALALLASRAVQVTPLITHRFPLERAREALELARDRKDVAVKVMVQVAGP